MNFFAGPINLIPFLKSFAIFGLIFVLIVMMIVIVISIIASLVTKQGYEWLNPNSRFNDSDYFSILTRNLLIITTVVAILMLISGSLNILGLIIISLLFSPIAFYKSRKRFEKEDSQKIVYFKEDDSNTQKDNGRTEDK